MRATVQGAVLIAAAACGLSQSENEPYFSLASSRTFPSHGKPSVRVSAWKVDALEFRVYRVADPLQFFQQIEDPHQFGAPAPAPPRERTLIERLHSWKRRLRAGVRRELRAQFTESPRAHLLGSERHGRQQAPAPATARQTRYAEAPLLNSQQLVLSFVQPVQTASGGTGRRWSGAGRKGRVPGGGGEGGAAGLHHRDGVRHGDDHQDGPAAAS